MGLWNWMLRRRDIDDDLHAEIRSHLTMAERDRVEDDQAPDAARLQARKECGNVLRRNAVRMSASSTAVPGNRACGECPDNLPEPLRQYCERMTESPQG